MKIVFALDYFSEGTGYYENILTPLMAARGHDVYIVASTMQVYGDAPYYNSVYSKFLGPNIVEPCRKMMNGVHLIRLPILCWWWRFRLTRGLIKEVLKLKPDVVQTFEPRSMLTLLLCIVSPFSTFKLFTGEHTVASVYPAYFSFSEWPFYKRLYLRLTDTVFGWFANRRVQVCYATTPDAAEIAFRFHGVSEKAVKNLPLGVDTLMFHPSINSSDQEERARLRSELGVQPSDILCIYTGRFTNAKNPNCLAKAVAHLRKQGRPFKGVFLGEGEQSEEIASVEDCQVKAFVPFTKLAQYYRAADIGVWPCQESIGMLDAAACGIPIVVSESIKARERVDGNGLTYSENDSASLANQLAKLENQELRAKLGQHGTEKMHAEFSILRNVDIMLKDYDEAIKG